MDWKYKALIAAGALAGAVYWFTVLRKKTKKGVKGLGQEMPWVTGTGPEGVDFDEAEAEALAAEQQTEAAMEEPGTVPYAQPVYQAPIYQYPVGAQPYRPVSAAAAQPYYPTRPTIQVQQPYQYGVPTQYPIGVSQQYYNPYAAQVGYPYQVTVTTTAATAAQRQKAQIIAYGVQSGIISLVTSMGYMPCGYDGTDAKCTKLLRFNGGGKTLNYNQAVAYVQKVLKGQTVQATYKVPKNKAACTKAGGMWSKKLGAKGYGCSMPYYATDVTGQVTQTGQPMSVDVVEGYY